MIIYKKKDEDNRFVKEYCWGPTEYKTNFSKITHYLTSADATQSCVSTVICNEIYYYSNYCGGSGIAIGAFYLYFPGISYYINNNWKLRYWYIYKNILNKSNSDYCICIDYNAITQGGATYNNNCYKNTYCLSGNVCYKELGYYCGGNPKICSCCSFKMIIEKISSDYNIYIDGTKIASNGSIDIITNYGCIINGVASVGFDINPIKAKVLHGNAKFLKCYL